MVLVRVCDICKSYEDVETKSFIIDRKLGSAGKMESVGETFDLCPKCLSKAYERAVSDYIKHELGTIDWAFNRIMIRTIKEMQKEIGCEKKFSVFD